MSAEDIMEEVRPSVRSFAEKEVIPVAGDLDRRNQEIPMDILRKMAELGYMGIIFPTDYGGSGLNHQAMVVVAEELSRAWLSVGSIMTRSLITGTLILANGTEEQKREWLPKIATGEILTAAAFTEPNHGSDTASFECRATPAKGGWSLNGQKTWCTLANRASILTVLARTDPDPSKKHKGLSMLLAAKKPGDGFEPPHLTGEHIPHIGYRGMKCYSLSFEDFFVPGENLIGLQTNRGFYQLMATYETARIQTAARAVGVGQAALEAALKYAKQRTQFGKPIHEHQVIRHKLAEMAARVEAARQLTYYAARMKDSGKRCDLEAGMAKVIATEMVETVTREAVQIHGGYGYSEEFDVQRYWRDGKVFSLFEGTTEIQMDVIGKRLMEK
ncbi:MAG: acyl-CoA dehydrogenase family protein [Euryarchaeota archaeon]|nr:acyl-CoA dehydrogenase family protein [Euryarchaeota archaeon]